MAIPPTPTAAHASNGGGPASAAAQSNDLGCGRACHEVKLICRVGLKRKLVENIYFQHDNLRREQEDFPGKHDDKLNNGIKIKIESPSKKAKSILRECNGKVGKEECNNCVIHKEDNANNHKKIGKSCLAHNGTIIRDRFQIDERGIIHNGQSDKDGGKVHIDDMLCNYYKIKDGSKIHSSKEMHNESYVNKKDKSGDVGDIRRGSILKYGNITDYYGIHAQAKPFLKATKSRKYAMQNADERIDAYTTLPQGTVLRIVGGVELSEGDVGPALQFLEFCSAFAKVLGIKKGQPEIILRELLRGLGRRGLNSTVVWLHVKLLSLLCKDSGKTSLRCTTKNGNSWLQALRVCFTELEFSPKEVPLDFISEGICGYDNLDTFQKLRILNFLCDETLNTGVLRRWIEKENIKYNQRRREAREKACIEKKKEKCLKQAKGDEVQTPLSLEDSGSVPLSKHDDSTSQKSHAKNKSHLKLSYGKHGSDALRTESVLRDGAGRVFWRLKGHCNSSGLMFQDVKKRDLVESQDTWFIYDDDEEKDVEKHISFVRNLTSRRCRRLNNEVS